MIDIAIDFETFYSDDYSLRQMTTREYIMDERFEVMLLAVKVDDGPRQVLEPHEIRPWLGQWDWSQVRLAAHNMRFDGAILAWHYGIRPKLYECSMFMAQAVVGHVIGSASLQAVNEHAGRTKDSQALLNMKGLPYLAAREHAEWPRYKAYAGQDVDDCRFHVKRFREKLPNRYRLTVDLLCRMYIDSKLRLDPQVLEENLRLAAAERERLLAAAGMTEGSELRSKPKFAKLLEGQGVQVPMKLSLSTGKPDYAFAKKDLGFIALLSHPKPEVRMLVEARLNAASSIEETRTRKFQRLAALPGATLNVPLLFSGAHTHRFSGADSMNLQNLPRKSLLRQAIRAPKGYKLVVLDASQIEARILAWLAGCLELVGAFSRGEDVYSLFASKVFGFLVNKREHPGERFVGKTSVLGLGYMTGADTLYKTLVLGAQSLGIDIAITPQMARESVDTYRAAYPEIVALWRQADLFTRSMALRADTSLGPFSTEFSLLDAPGWTIPGGLPVRYPSLNSAVDDDTGRVQYVYWRHRYKTWTSLYGGKLVENMVQHLAWTVIVNAMARMHLTNPAWTCVLQVHDELAYLAPDDEAQDCYDHLHGFMCAQPDWSGYGPLTMVPVPLQAEGGIGEIYGEIK